MGNINPEINGFVAAAKSIAADAETFFGSLSAAQLNWQPNQETWSVGQCLAHLIKTNNEMLGAVESHVNGAHRKSIFERFALGSNYFGKYILKAVQPENKKKLKAPKIFRPTTSNVDVDIVKKFIENQQNVTELMDKSKNLDLEKTIITSPIAPFITYSLFDAYRIIVTHERRHFRQAQDVMEVKGFPKVNFDV